MNTDEKQLRRLTGSSVEAQKARASRVTTVFLWSLFLIALASYVLHEMGVTQ